MENSSNRGSVSGSFGKDFLVFTYGCEERLFTLLPLGLCDRMAGSPAAILHHEGMSLKMAKHRNENSLGPG